MGAEADRVDLLLALVLDPRLDQVLGEHPALEQELVVLLEGVEGVGERARDAGDLGQLLLGEKARYGLAVGSGERNSIRFAFSEAW
jgi:hypothetical protein